MRAMIVAAALALGAAAPASAVVFLPSNLLVNGSFESPAITTAPWYIRSFASTPGWTQFGDGVDLVHNNYTQPPPVLLDASDGVQFLDMNQGGVAGGVFQTVSATVGATYTLKLDVGAWATNAIGGGLRYQLYDPTSDTVLVTNDVYDTVGNGSWTTVTLSAAAISSTIGVRFASLSAPQAAIGVDNVRLTVSPVPEPGEWAMIAAGLAIVGGVARKRKAVRR